MLKICCFMFYFGWCKNIDRRRNYGQKSKFKMAAVSHLGFSKNWFWQIGCLRVSIFHLCTKFGEKMLIDAQIIAKNQNSRWRPSAILDFRKSDFWPIVRLRVLIFHLSTKCGAKMLIDAEIMAKNLNSRWRPSAILEFLYHRIGPPT